MQRLLACVFLNSTLSKSFVPKYLSKKNFDIALHFFHQFDNFRCSNIVIGMNFGRSGEPDIAVKKLSLAARTQKKAQK
jgi:hypothetical protein